ncbi:MAG: FG-GAP-like repeat-containing protein, partial [Nitrospirae bacterium]|nr:FG-GAP-like repeat-containing protein [Nitrospirota bacterium]
SAASLDGTVNDDGFPNPPGMVTTTWNKVSGPGTVTFDNSNAVDTTANFTLPGTYVLRLTADDGALTTSAEVTITVNPAPPINQAPSVDAGPDQTVLFASGADLDGTVSDDGLPNPPGALTTTWSQESGPVPVTFGGANNVDTNVSLSAPGVYELRLSANDSDLTASDTVTIISTFTPATGFTAYNDLAWGTGQLTTNITTFSSPNGGSGLPSTGQLVDFTTGIPTPVTLTVVGGTFNGGSHATQGADPTTGDAFAIFDGKVNGQGVLSYIDQTASDLILTLTALAPNRLYDLTYFAHRDDYVWDRASLVTISGQDAFINQSSIAIDNPSEAGGGLFSGPTDPSTRLPADNDQGYVARFSNIDPGSDGAVVLTIRFDGNGASQSKGKYGSALRLREFLGQGTPTNQPPTVNAGASQTITFPNVAILDGTVVLTISFDGNMASQFLGKYASALRLIESGSTSNDVDGDGKDDLVWRNTATGDVGAWLGNGLTLGSTGILAAGVAADWVIAGLGDVDGDGNDDLVLRNTAPGDAQVWLGTGGLTLGATDILAAGVAAEWVIKGLGDLDGDGKDDIVLRNTIDGSVGAWLGNGLTLGATGIIAGAALEWVIAGLGDVDGDGKDDIVLRNTTTGDAGVWLGNGLMLGATGIIAAGVATEWIIVGLIDLDGNGKDDIVLRNTSTGDVGAWLGNGLMLGATGILAGSVPLEWEIQ